MINDDQNVYQQIGRLTRKQIADEEKLNELKQVKRRKLAECERQTIEAMKDYLSSSEPIWNRMHQDSNELLALEKSLINSTTPFIDSFRDLRVYLDRKFLDVDRKFDDLDRRFVDLDRKFERKFADFDRRFERKLIDFDKNFAQLSLQMAQLKNMNLNKDGEDVNPVPFLDGTWPKENNLPELRTISDIDVLAKDQCRKYLTGYGVSFRENETVSLKEKLGNVIGFSFLNDHMFRDFDM